MKVLSRRQFFGVGALAGLSLCSCSTLPRMPWAKETGSFSFAVLGGFFLTDMKSTGMVTKAITRINADPAVKFVVVTGDMATHGKLPELNLAKITLDALKKPYSVVPGVHDLEQVVADGYANFVRAFDRVEDKKKDSRWSHRLLLQPHQFHNNCWAFSCENWVFIGLDTASGGIGANPLVKEDDFVWLKKQLHHAGKSTPIGIFSYRNLFAVEGVEQTPDIGRVGELLGSYSVRVIALGNYRGNRELVQGTTLITNTACCSSTIENENGVSDKGYRLFQVTAEKIESSFVALE